MRLAGWSARRALAGQPERHEDAERLANSDPITAENVSQAIQYRGLDRMR
jgi:hypothetical protein